jgi:hypothetical protein
VQGSRGSAATIPTARKKYIFPLFDDVLCPMRTEGRERSIPRARLASEAEGLAEVKTSAKPAAGCIDSMAVPIPAPGQRKKPQPFANGYQVSGRGSGSNGLARQATKKRLPPAISAGEFNKNATLRLIENCKKRACQSAGTGTYWRA